MEKRFSLFLVISTALWLTYFIVDAKLNPRPPVDEQAVADAGQAGDNAAGDDAAPDGDVDGQVQAGAAEQETQAGAATRRAENGAPAEDGAAGSDAADNNAADNNAADNGGADNGGADSGDKPAADGADSARPQDYPVRRWSVGSLDPTSDYRLLVTFNSVGAAVERIELNNPRYQELENDAGFLGSLALRDDPRGGCEIRVVGAGTPAARAQAAGVTGGLRGPLFGPDENGQSHQQAPGDRILEFAGEPIRTQADLADQLVRTKPGQSVEIVVERTGDDGTTKSLSFTTSLIHQPLSVVRPDAQFLSETQPNDHPMSFLLGLYQIGDRTTPHGQDELQGLVSLKSETWSGTPLEDAGDGRGPGIEFRRRLTGAELKQWNLDGALELVKRFRLKPAPPATDDEVPVDPLLGTGYNLTLDIEIENLGEQPARVGYRIQGPTGLPLEGWWYSSKVHPSKWFAGAGARDVIWRPAGGRHELFSCSQITDQAEEDPTNRDYKLFVSETSPTLRYVGCDAQYFTVAMLPAIDAEADDPFTRGENFVVANAVGRAVGPLDEQRGKRTEVTFALDSQVVEIPAGAALQHRYTIFAGPKDPEVLEQFGLEECIVYGLFGRISRPMVWLLHVFYSIVRNYGVAIVMLTVLVRGCMFPLGRKMALNAQKMQELAPEMKKIADKYKNDMEKRTQAQRELFLKHNYNPFSGCLVMFLQIPIFIGLYRGISVDVALRQTPLIPGIAWCSNLAGPDMLLHWENFIPGFLSDRTGWLGPYLNILPVITVCLFLVQQKLFTPPPTDDQQRMQQQMMKFMMLFMGVMFHKVAAGLCIYFISSSLWGVAERLLLPKTKAGGDASDSGAAGDTQPAKSQADTSQPAKSQSLKTSFLTGKKADASNGAESVAETKRRRKQRRQGR